MAREKFAQSRHAMSYIVAVAARWTKSLKFTLSIAADRGGLAKNNFLACGDAKKENWIEKKRIECVLNPFHRQKIKENFFPTGSRDDRS